ncbi:MAG: response regulator, partial [Proteobacteria bacterium]|nr:response regulator [Pseudomonadota bacterium]
LAIISDILDISKIEAGKLALSAVPFSVAAELAKVAMLMGQRAEQSSVVFVAHIPSDLPPCVKGDPLRISQVLYNLIGNSLKFTRPNGAIVFVTEQRITGAGRIELCCSVSDTGIGIPPDKSQVIFETFSQGDPSVSREFGGSGLGLSIARSLVEAMGGRIWFESRIGVGSCFHFTVPLVVLDASHLPISSRTIVESPMPLYQNRSVLVAEDNLVNQKLAKRLLEKMGYQVRIANNGREAVDLFRSGGYSLILMDLQMPVLNGLDAAREIRQIEEGAGEKIPILAMTANVFESDKLECIASGMNGFVEKPIRAEQLYSEIQRAMDLLDRSAKVRASA